MLAPSGSTKLPTEREMRRSRSAASSMTGRLASDEVVENAMSIELRMARRNRPAPIRATNATVGRLPSPAARIGLAGISSTMKRAPPGSCSAAWRTKLESAWAASRSAACCTGVIDPSGSASAATRKPIAIATRVVPQKKPSVRAPSRPTRRMSPSPATPANSAVTTSGITTIDSRVRNSAPSGRSHRPVIASSSGDWVTAAARPRASPAASPIAIERWSRTLLFTTDAVAAVVEMDDKTPGVITLAVGRRALRGHHPQPAAAAGARPAAVSLVLVEGPRGVDLLLIRRAERPDDPWSGQIALPGGRQDPDDVDLLATAARETREETGVELASAERLAVLDDLAPS